MIRGFELTWREVGRGLERGVQRVGDWLFRSGAVGEVVWVPSGESVDSDAVCLELWFGASGALSPEGPVVQLADPRRLLQVAERVQSLGIRVDWRVRGAELILAGEIESLGFGPRWFAEFARCVAPGRVFWSCPEEKRAKLEARVIRIAPELRRSADESGVEGGRRAGWK